MKMGKTRLPKYINIRYQKNLTSQVKNILKPITETILIGYSQI